MGVLDNGRMLQAWITCAKNRPKCGKLKSIFREIKQWLTDHFSTGDPICIKKVSKTGIIGYKTALYYMGSTIRPVILKLYIPKDALTTKYKTSKYHKLFGGKLRCSKAKVIGYYSIKTGKPYKGNFHPTCFSWMDYRFKYPYDVFVEPDHGFSKRPYVCSHGIHYFETMAEAMEYYVKYY